MEILGFIVLDLVLVLLFCRLGRRKKYHKNDIEYIRKVRGAHELEQLARQLDELDEILTQIELARYHHLKGVTITLPDAIAGDHGHTLLINGHDNNTRALAALVLGEREQLRELLDKKIQKLAADGTTQLHPGEILHEIRESAALSQRPLASLSVINDHRYGVINTEGKSDDRG